MERRFFVVLQYLIDTGLHSNVIWAWATMRLIFGIEYPEFSAKMSALAFTIAFSVTGLWTILVGWVRDNKSFGLSRIGKEVEMTIVNRNFQPQYSMLLRTFYIVYSSRFGEAQPLLVVRLCSSMGQWFQHSNNWFTVDDALPRPFWPVDWFIDHWRNCIINHTSSVVSFGFNKHLDFLKHYDYLGRTHPAFASYMCFHQPLA